MGRILARLLDESWDSYWKRLGRLKSGITPRRVHRLRVAARRLLTSLDLLIALDPGTGLTRGRATLERRFSALGSLRDAQVQRLELDQQPLPKAKLRSLRQVLKRRIRRLSRSAAKAGVGGLRRAIKRASARLASMPQSGASSRLLSSQLNGAVRSALARARALRPRRPGDLSQLHRARIAIKQYRYLLELLRPLATGVDERLIERLQACQTLMGEIHDTDLFIARMERWVTKGRLDGKDFEAIVKPLDRRRECLVADYFRSADALFASRRSPVRVPPG